MREVEDQERYWYDGPVDKPSEFWTNCIFCAPTKPVVGPFDCLAKAQDHGSVCDACASAAQFNREELERRMSFRQQESPCR